MPGMAELIEGAVQQAPQPGRQLEERVDIMEKVYKLSSERNIISQYARRTLQKLSTCDYEFVNLNN
jgi:cell division protein FtsB